MDITTQGAITKIQSKGFIWLEALGIYTILSKRANYNPKRCSKVECLKAKEDMQTQGAILQTERTITTDDVQEAIKTIIAFNIQNP